MMRIKEKDLSNLRERNEEMRARIQEYNKTAAHVDQNSSDE
jgi:hypothetical protein